MNPRKLPPVHPGEVLLEEFLKPLDLSQYRLAKDMSVPPRRVNEIVLRKRSITADTALRLSRFFGTSPEFWLNLQSQYDLDVESDRLGKRLDAEVVQFSPRAERTTRASLKRLRPASLNRPSPATKHPKRRPA